MKTLKSRNNTLKNFTQRWISLSLLLNLIDDRSNEPLLFLNVVCAVLDDARSAGDSGEPSLVAGEPSLGVDDRDRIMHAGWAGGGAGAASHGPGC